MFDALDYRNAMQMKLQYKENIMVIAKMNSVLVKHSRILFGVITGVIIISFVWFFTPGADGSILFGNNPMSPNAVVGKAFGQEITRSQLMDAIRDSVILQAVSYNMKPDMHVFGENARQNAFGIAARLAAAKELGVQVSLSRVGEFIRELPAFRKDGKFDASLYQAYEKNALQPSGYNALDLDHAVRTFLTIGALGNLAAEDLVVTPDEVRNFALTMLEKYEVRTIRFPYASARKALNPSEADLKNYHKANSKDFMTLPEYKIKMIRFPYPAYEDKVKLPADAAEKYYKAHKDSFRKNGKQQSFAEVSKKIKADLLKAEAEKLAVREARAFREHLYDVTEELEPSAFAGAVQKAAEQKKYPVLESVWFNRESKGFDPALIREVENLRKQSPITKTIRIKNAAVIAVLTDSKPARPASYKESASKVLKAYLDSRSKVTADENARNFRAASLKTKLSAGTLAALAKGGEVKALPLFDLNSPSKEISPEVLQLASDTMNGQLSNQVNTAEGPLMIYVVRRIPPDEKTLLREKARFADMYRRSKTFAVTDAFNAWIAGNVSDYTRNSGN